MHLTFTVTDNATPRVVALERALHSDALKVAAGTGLRKEVRTHLRALPPNIRFPEQTTGFYKQAARSVTAPEVNGDGVTISITQVGIRQRYFGGTILPTAGHKYLTIPAQGFAYGRRASEFTGDVKFAFARNEQGFLAPALVAGDAGAGISGLKPRRRKKGEEPKPPIQPDQVLFWLIKKAVQPPNPNVLPTPEELQSAAAGGMRSFIRSRLHDPGADVRIVADDEEDA